MEIRQLTAEPEDHNNLHLQEVRQRVETDQEYQDLKCVIQNGFPDQKGSMPDHLKKYWGVRDTLSVDDDLIVHGCRLLIPLSLRPTILSRLHEAHQGVSRSQARARLTIYWPGIDLRAHNSSPSPDKIRTKLSNVRTKMPNSGQILIHFPINFQNVRTIFKCCCEH